MSNFSYSFVGHQSHIFYDAEYEAKKKLEQQTKEANTEWAIINRIVNDKNNDIVFSFFSWPDDNGWELFERSDIEDERTGHWKEIQGSYDADKFYYKIKNNRYYQLVEEVDCDGYDVAKTDRENEDKYGPPNDYPQYRTTHIVTDLGKQWLKQVLDANTAKLNKVIDWDLVPAYLSPEEQSGACWDNVYKMICEVASNE